MKTANNVLEKLPVAREKVETLAILRQLSASTAALGELKGAANILPNQEILINAIVLQEAKDSSEIENIITTRDELYKALATTDNQPASIKEVINYRRTIFQGYELIKKQGFLRLNDLTGLQKTILENDAGIRSTPGTVLKNDKTGEVDYTPPQHKDEILELLTNFLEHFNLSKTDQPKGQTGLPILINLAILHYQFESIHPFYDGNGRTGRILNILYLILNNQINVPILYLSSFIIENKAEYYRLLNTVNKTNEWEEWILYLLKAVEQTSFKTIDKINSIKILLDKTVAKTQKEASKIYKKELVELLFEEPYSKIEFVTKKLGVERKAASRYLKKMEEIGILCSEKIGRETIYINQELINVLQIR